MKQLKYLSFVVVVFVLMWGNSFADARGSVLNFLIPPDYSGDDLCEYTLDIPSVMSLYGESITLSDYIKRTDDFNHSSGLSCIPTVSAYDIVLNQMNDNFLSIPHNTLNQFTVICDFFNSGTKDYSGSYYQFVVTIKKAPREEYIFFIDALSGDLLAPPMHMKLNK